MTRHLLAISVGPVQSFIAAARKTRDLWFGSWLLSEVSRAAAVALRDDHSAELIFPHPDALADGPDTAVANKLLTLLPDGVAPADAAATARSAAVARLTREWAAIVRDRRADPALVDHARVEEQLATFLEIQAAWVPLPTDGMYQRQRERLERLLAGRKALRDFEQPPARPGLVKSSLDPSRESVIHDRAYAPDVAGTQDRQRLGIKRGEHLDGISLVKRLARPRRFVSVSRVAADPWVRCAAAQDRVRLDALAQLADQLVASRAVERLPGDAAGLGQYAAFPYDLELFYDAGQTDDRLDAEPYRSLARTFFEQVHKSRLGDVPAYYAVLHADGDRMGTLIGNLTSPAAHRALSKRLVEFAAAARQIVTRHQGALVYAGGDDVLALLPLDTALDCADALRRTFSSLVGTSSGQPLADSVSLSVGIAIAHYNEPLTVVLDWARAAERHAKGWRNSLAVAFHTRSGGGEATTVRHYWSEEPVTDHWGRWIDWHRRDTLPDGAAYELRGLLAELAGLGDAEALANLLPREVARVLARKRTRAGDGVEWRALAEQILRPSAGDAMGLTPLDRATRFVDGLIVSRRIAQAVALADGGTGGRP